MLVSIKETNEDGERDIPGQDYLRARIALRYREKDIISHDG